MLFGAVRNRTNMLILLQSSRNVGYEFNNVSQHFFGCEHVALTANTQRKPYKHVVGQQMFVVMLANMIHMVCG